eukprot:CAMPEP_0181139658 /NCGR_PEP_ID=MMETSP1071-20121207/34898_1 /TAXON_ID=35127 /ORGANISM="Thalassiosira sp., Strain NH16" /LENGTH=267 /DNA_ID=CAMNT_0023226577 /DNA_START=251 /DNA_END=1054 /DNA_ORIENTATION=+
MSSSSKSSAAHPALSPDADGPLSSFELRGYRPSPILSEDESYMDIVMIITRSSKLRQGSMGCILVRQTHESMPDGKEPNNSQNKHTNDHTDRILGRIIAAATNTDLFHNGDSDVHAEINAIGQVAKHHRNIQTDITSSTINAISTQGATAYITMPPCKRCFGALYASGIKRIVSRRQHGDILMKAASKVGIEMSCLTQKELGDQKVRLDQLFAIDNIEEVDSKHKNVADGDNAEEILRRRKQRKEEKRARKIAKIAKETCTLIPKSR